MAVTLFISLVVLLIQTPRVFAAYCASGQNSPKLRVLLIHCGLLLMSVSKLIAVFPRMLCYLNNQPTDTSACFSYMFGSPIVRLLQETIPLLAFLSASTMFQIALTRAYTSAVQYPDAVRMERAWVRLEFVCLGSVFLVSSISSIAGPYLSFSQQDTLLTALLIIEAVSIWIGASGYLIYGLSLARLIRKHSREAAVMRVCFFVCLRSFSFRLCLCFFFCVFYFAAHFCAVCRRPMRFSACPCSSATSALATACLYCLLQLRSHVARSVWSASFPCVFSSFYSLFVFLD